MNGDTKHIAVSPLYTVNPFGRLEGISANADRQEPIPCDIAVAEAAVEQEEVLLAEDGTGQIAAVLVLVGGALVCMLVGGTVVELLVLAEEESALDQPR